MAGVGCGRRPCLLSGDSAWVTGKLKPLMYYSCAHVRYYRGTAVTWTEGGRRCCAPEVRKWKHTDEPINKRKQNLLGPRVQMFWRNVVEVPDCKYHQEVTHSSQTTCRCDFPAASQSRLQHLSSLKSVSGLSGQLTWHQVSSRDVSSSTYWENHCCHHCCSFDGKQWCTSSSV